MRRALSIHEKSFGDDHPNVARDLNNLASLLQDDEPAVRGGAVDASSAEHR